MRQDGDDGFMLIEALVALAILALSLAVIGQLGFSSLSAARRAAERLALTQAARGALAALPARAADASQTSGRWDDGEWTLALSPYGDVPPGGPVPPRWFPARVRVEAKDVAGAKLSVETVRLRRLGAP